MHGRGAINFMSQIERLMDSSILYFSDQTTKEKINYGLNNNLNIVNQQGVFTWNSNPAKPLEHMANEEFGGDNHEVKVRFSKCININKKLAPYIKTKLESSGITKSFLYPDPYFIANAAFEKTIM